MDEAERRTFLLHSKLHVFQRHVKRALDVIAEGLRYGQGCVSCSWGKDSVVLLHLSYLVDSGIAAVHVCDDNTDIMDNYNDVRESFLNQYPIQAYHEIRTTFGGASVPALMDKFQSYPVTLMGLRRQEQGGRVHSIRNYGEIHQYKTGARAGSWRVLPLAYWTWMDVWAYTVLNGLPYLRSYDSVYSGPKSYSRTSPVYTGRTVHGDGSHGGMHAGRIARLKRYSPEYYQILAEMAPEIASMS